MSVTVKDIESYLSFRLGALEADYDDGYMPLDEFIPAANEVRATINYIRREKAGV